ncbi:hypothetical protein L2E82_22788 [Cichorium intybus]|uniref:Uncharacterized protein n=1 Tax=Cichorium intybus TaxID=13427 RepID=A0ACB9DYQ8_CICIN|nr:hypothetical protein L2E82_22788 [Cichorium intybus]
MQYCAQFYQVCQLRPADEVGGYVHGEGIVVCSNYMNIQDEVNQVVIHELIHAYDDCRAANLDWTNCAHHACSETRAGHLSGHCHYKRELLRGQIYDVSSDAKSRFCQKVPLKISTCIYVSPDLFAFPDLDCVAFVEKKQFLRNWNLNFFSNLMVHRHFFILVSPILLQPWLVYGDGFVEMVTSEDIPPVVLDSGTGVMKADEVKGNINIDDV